MRVDDKYLITVATPPQFDLLSSFQKVGDFGRKQFLSSFVSRQGRFFIPGSPSRPSNRQLAHHPERCPCSLLFHPLRPVRLVNCQQPKPRKPTRPSCAAKRPRYVPWTAAHERPICHPGSFGQHDSVEQSGNARHRSRSKHGDGGFGPSHRDGGNRTLKLEGRFGGNETSNIEG
jgi:hypothetical protein